MKVTIDVRAVGRRIRHHQYVDDLRDGRRQRAATFKPKKGRGSYVRNPKHRGS